MADVQYKTAVNTRASLASRMPKKKTEAVHVSASLHQKAETTYDTTYTAAPAGRAAATLRDTQHGTEGSERGSPMGAETDAALTASVVATTGDRQQEADQRRGYRVLCYPSAEWESASHAASRNVQPEQQLDFYATARKIEQVDDNNRSGLVGSMQRSMDIRTKRAEDATLRPATPSYPNMQPRTLPPIVAEERYGVKRNYLDLVECTQLKPRTEEQIGFSDAPLARLPGETLSQDLKVQSKIITTMGISHELFRGTAKYLNDTPVGYAGHIPMSDRNVAAIHHGNDAQRLFAKSHMTLAEHGGGVELPPSVGSRVWARRRKGNNTQAVKALPPKSTEAIKQTAEGRMQQMSLYGTLDRERQMNVRNDARSQNYF
jgi:hypothetical protein